MSCDWRVEVKESEQKLIKVLKELLVLFEQKKDFLEVSEDFVVVDLIFQVKLQPLVLNIAKDSSLC